MATIVPPQGSFNRAETQKRIRHPLQRLRAYIRSYVSLEGAAVFFLYLVIWFWVGLLLDFGVFKLFGLDWVRDMPGLVGGHEFGILRVGMLVVLLSGLVALVVLKVVLRLAREFRDRSLALVLERRFPKLLGDRLITAVEMADPRLAAEYGHSQAMVDQTVREAAERVDQVPVSKVFNWKRLYWYGAVLLGLTVGLYVLVGIGYCLFADEDVEHYFYRSRDVAAVWVERNLLLADSLWPRNAYLEVIRFQGSKQDPNEMRIGDHNPSPELWVRATQWVKADPKSPDGWRPLRWDDLEGLLGKEGSRVSLPDNWNGWANDPDDPFPGTWTTWSVDRVYLEVEEKAETRRRLREQYPAAYKDFEAVFARLQQLDDEGSREREVRKLDLPGKVELLSYNLAGTVGSKKSFTKREDNKYQTGLTLTESIKFVVRADDFSTPEKRITLVPRPRLKLMTANRREPAYIYYHMKGDPGDLGPQRALMGARLDLKDLDVPLSPDQTFAQAAYIELPSGSDIILFGETTEPLRDAVRVRPFQDEKGGLKGVELVGVQTQFVDGGDRKKFKLEFKNVTQPLDFVLTFANEDGVGGECHVTIEPKADTHPEVSLQMVKNVFRQKPNTEYYMVTPLARVPFEGSISDDRGLNRVVWSYRAWAAKKEEALSQVRLLLTALPFASGPSGPLVGPTFSAWWSERLVKTAEKAKGAKAQVVAQEAVKDDFQLRGLLTAGTVIDGEKLIPRFLNEVNFRKDDEVADAADLAALLEKGKVPRRGLVKQVRLRTEDDAFSFRDYLNGLKEPSGNSALQLRVVVEVWVTAVDNNVQVEHPVRQLLGPGEVPEPGRKPAREPGAVSESKQRFLFLVVGENELLAEIAKEEEDLRIELERIYKKLQEAQTKLNTQVVPNLKDGLDKDTRQLKATRADEVKKTIGLNARDLGVLYAAFARILNEEEYNEVSKETVGRMQDGIVDPLRIMLDKNTGVFRKAEQAAEALQNLLDNNGKGTPAAGAEAQKHLDDLLHRLDGVLSKMQKISDDHEAIRRAIEIEELQRKQSEVLDKFAKDLRDFLIKGLE